MDADRACDAFPTDIFCQGWLPHTVTLHQERTLSRAARLLALLQALRCRRRPVTAAALARELHVSERTLTEDETEAVLLGLRYVDQRGDDVLTKAAANAHAKILAVLPQEGQIVATLPMAIPGPKAKGFPENTVPLSALRSAIRTCRRLAIGYVNAEGRQTRRVIWPIQLSFMDNARVVTGWCEPRKAFRFFRTDRISSAEGVDIRAVLDLLHGQLDRELTPPRIGCPKTEGVEGIPLGRPIASVDNQPTECPTRVFE